MKKIGIMLLIAVLLVSCATTTRTESAPSWLDHPYDELYKSEQYLAAVGSGSTREQAVDRARTALAHIFTSQVRSTTDVTTLSTSILDEWGGEVFTHATEMLESGGVSTYVDSIIGSEVANLYVDPMGVVHARLVIDRKKSAALYRQQADELARQRTTLRVQRTTMASSLAQYVALLQEISLAHQEQAINDQIQLLLGMPQRPIVMALETELALLASQITVEVHLDGDSSETKQIKAAFEAALQQLGFTLLQKGGEYRVMAEFGVEEVKLKDSPYQYARWTLSARLFDSSRTYLSCEESSREAALSSGEAKARAVQAAVERGVNKFVAQLLQSRIDEM